MLDTERILSTLVSPIALLDRKVWITTKNGSFSIKMLIGFIDQSSMLIKLHPQTLEWLDPFGNSVEIINSLPDYQCGLGSRIEVYFLARNNCTRGG